MSTPSVFSVKAATHRPAPAPRRARNARPRAPPGDRGGGQASGKRMRRMLQAVRIAQYALPQAPLYGRCHKGWRTEVHIRHPQRQQIITPRGGAHHFIFQAVSVPAVNAFIKIIVHHSQVLRIRYGIPCHSGVPYAARVMTHERLSRHAPRGGRPPEARQPAC